MKYKNSLKKLEERRKVFDNSKAIQTANQRCPGTHKRPGSQNRNKN